MSIITPHYNWLETFIEQSLSTNCEELLWIEFWWEKTIHIKEIIDLFPSEGISESSRIAVMGTYKIATDRSQEREGWYVFLTLGQRKD